MYGLSWFAEIQILRICWLYNSANSTVNCVYLMYRLSGLAKNLNSTDTLQVQNGTNLIGNCVHQIYGLSGFVENLNSTDTLVNRITQIKQKIVRIRCKD